VRERQWTSEESEEPAAVMSNDSHAEAASKKHHGPQSLVYFFTSLNQPSLPVSQLFPYTVLFLYIYFIFTQSRTDKLNED